MGMRIIGLLCVVLALGGCQSVKTVGAFDPHQQAVAEQALKSGTGKISGHAFIRAPSGRIFTAAGNFVYLVPATPYADERFSKMFSGGRFNAAMFGNSLDSPDPDYARLMRKIKSGMSGQFEFDHVKPGRYYVSATVQWVPSGEALPRGGAVMDEVVVRGGETVKVVISGH